MLKIDFRQYQQTQRAEKAGKKAILCMPARSSTEVLSARREAAKLLSGLLGNNRTEKTEESAGICKKQQPIV